MPSSSATIRLIDIIEAIELIKNELADLTIAAFEADKRKRWLENIYVSPTGKLAPIGYEEDTIAVIKPNEEGQQTPQTMLNGGNGNPILRYGYSSDVLGRKADVASDNYDETLLVYSKPYSNSNQSKIL